MARTRHSWRLSALVALVAAPVLVTSLPVLVGAAPSPAAVTTRPPLDEPPPLTGDPDPRVTTRDGQHSLGRAGQGSAAPALVCYPMRKIRPSVPGPVPLPQVEPRLAPVPMPRVVADCGDEPPMGPDPRR